MGRFVDAPNPVPHMQRYYFKAYQNTRLWRIGKRASWMYLPFLVTMWGTTAGCMWMMGRKVAGYNSIWGPK